VVSEPHSMRTTGTGPRTSNGKLRNQREDFRSEKARLNEPIGLRRTVECLRTAAQIAVTLAGFGGVVVVPARVGYEWPPIDEFSALRHSAATGIARTSLRCFRRINMEDRISFPRDTPAWSF